MKNKSGNLKDENQEKSRKLVGLKVEIDGNYVDISELIPLFETIRVAPCENKQNYER